MTARSRLVLVVLGMVGAGRDGRADEGTPSVEAVRAGVVARDAAVRNLSFVATYHERLPQGRVRGAALESSLQVLDVIVETGDRGGGIRARMDLLRSLDSEASKFAAEDDPTAPDGTKMGHRLSTTNEEGSRSIDSAQGGIRLATVEASRTLLWAIHPLEVLNLNYFSPSRALDGVHGERVAVAGRERIDGRETIRLTYDYDQTYQDGASLRGSYWIAPDLGFAVVRETTERRLKGPDAPWKEIVRKEATGFGRVGDVWLPGRVSVVKHNSYSDTGEYELSDEVVAEFTRWAVNVPVTDATFRLEFPDGAWVTDRIKGGGTYTQGKINDARIRRDVEQARKLARSDPISPDLRARLEASSRSRPFPAWRPWTWAGVVLLSVAMALIAILIRRRRSRAIP